MGKDGNTRGGVAGSATAGQGWSDPSVPEFYGSWDVPPVWFALCFLLLGLAALGGAATFSRWAAADVNAVVGAILLPVCGIGFGGAGLALLWLRRRLLRLAPLTDVAEKLGVGEEALSHYATDRDITPRFRVNGRLLYDPADFGSAATLLRPAQTPAEHATLLKPVGQTVSSTEGLLRPVRPTVEGPTEASATTGARGGIEEPLPVRSQPLDRPACWGSANGAHVSR
jgi:hypothetical protein